MNLLNEWEEIEIPIGQVEKYLNENYEIEVDSPDGWVKVDAFVDKGLCDEYIVNGIRSSKNHLFETSNGWKKAKDISSGELILSRDGYIEADVTPTGKKIPIVDITVDHPNHRYWTEHLSSHNTGVGKSLWMCHFAAHDLSVGRNVLYITNEMAEEKIAKRIDANLLHTDMGDIDKLSKKEYLEGIGRLKAKTEGKLIIKEYPTAASTVNHYRALLDELRIKKKFTPDVIYVDYLNIMASSRVRMGGAVNTYVLVKAIAEELRGLAIEYNLPIVSATQTNRDGYNNSDIGLDNTSESFGLPQTVDFMLGIMQTEELRKLGHFACKQLKNRYEDLGKRERFHVGVDKGKMKLFDVGDIDDTPVFDETNTGEAMEQFDGFVV